jgi:Emfourin
MNSRLHGVSLPVVLASTAILAIVIGAAAAFALSSGNDSSPDSVTATATSSSSPVVDTPTDAGSSTTTVVAPTPPPPTATTSPVPDFWTIEFERTGGFAGVAQTLRLDSAGQAHYEDKSAHRVEIGTLRAADLSELRALIDGSDFFSQAEKQDAPCADCFNLSLTVTLNGQSRTIQAVDIAVDATLRPLIDKLTILLQDGLGQ